MAVALHVPLPATPVEGEITVVRAVVVVDHHAANLVKVITHTLLAEAVQQAEDGDLVEEREEAAAEDIL